MSTWSIVVVRNTRDKFHRNFVTSLRAHPLLFKGVNLGISTTTQRKTREIVMTRMKARGHVVARL
jgi:hypothetical protein